MDINDANENFIYYCSRGTLQIIQDCINAGFDLSLNTTKVKEGLISAARSGNLDIFIYLIENEAPQDEIYGCFNAALYGKQIHILEYCLSLGYTLTDFHESSHFTTLGYDTNDFSQLGLPQETYDWIMRKKLAQKLNNDLSQQEKQTQPKL